MNLSKACLFVLCLALGACATNPVPYSESKPVPQDQVMLVEVTVPKTGTGHVTVTRDIGWSGGACSYYVLLDGHKVAKIKGGERLDLYLAPGDHLLGASAAGLCDTGVAEVAAKIEADSWTKYRVSSSIDGTVGLMATAF